MKLKRMVMVLLTVVALMGVSFASPVMADEVEDKHNDSSSAGLGVRDHPDDSSSSTVAEKEPLKDPGIRLCDITPTECQNTDDDSANHDPSSSPVEEEKQQQEDRVKDPGIRLCDITPTECPNTAEEDSAKKTPRGSGGEYSEYCKLPTFVYDPACDKNNEHNDKDSNDSQD